MDLGGVQFWREEREGLLNRGRSRGSSEEQERVNMQSHSGVSDGPWSWAGP